MNTQVEISPKLPNNIEDGVKLALQVGLDAYAKSPATTKAGRIFRFLSRFIPVDDLIGMVIHRTKNNL